jgi:CheY-like chemotaxis protein
MPPPSLNILVVDDRPDSVLFLTEFLLSRKHRVATIGNGKEALAAILRRRANDPYDLVICEISLPGLDGLGMLKDLRRRNDPIETAICTAYASVHPNLAQEAERLGCLAVLEKPTDLGTVDALLEQVGSKKKTAPGTSKSDQPFFGTSRIVRKDEITTSRLRRESSTPGAGLERRGDTAAPDAPPARIPSPLPFEESDRIPRRQVQSFSHNAPPVAQPATQPPTQTASGRIERPPSAIPLAPEAIVVPKPGEAAPDSKPLAPVTTRLRRTITGTERITRSAPPPQPEAGAGVPAGSRAVGCALCGKPFVVLDKATAYSVVCVHCGKLNSIEPLAS